MSKKTLYNTSKVKQDPIAKEFYQTDLFEFNINLSLNFLK